MNEYRVKEVKVGGEWKWTPQYRPMGSSLHWKPCLDDNGDKIYRVRGNDARHWLLWEEGSILYHDAGTDGNKVYTIDRNGKKPADALAETKTSTKVEKKKPPKKENEYDKFRYELFVCNCGDVSHQFVVAYDNHYGEADVFVEVKLNRSLPWYKRLVKGIKYIFGIGSPSIFGDYDEIVLDKSHIEGLQRVIEVLKQKED